MQRSKLWDEFWNAMGRLSHARDATRPRGLSVRLISTDQSQFRMAIACLTGHRSFQHLPGLYSYIYHGTGQDSLVPLFLSRLEASLSSSVTVTFIPPCADSKPFALSMAVALLFRSEGSN